MDKAYSEVILDITKGAIYTKIRDYLEAEKKELFKELSNTKTLGSFIDDKVDNIYTQMQIFVFNGHSEEEAYEYIVEDIYFK